MLRPTLVVLLFSIMSFGQTAQVVQKAQIAATVKDIQHLRFVLLNIASLDHDPASIQQFESMLVKQFGLSAQDSAAIHNAGQSLRPVLAQNRQAAQAIVAGKTALSQEDLSAIQSLEAQREQTILSLANQVLNSVSPVVAARLLATGTILNAATGGIPNAVAATAK